MFKNQKYSLQFQKSLEDVFGEIIQLFNKFPTGQKHKCDQTSVARMANKKICTVH